jgi:hypothetical protein
MGMLTVSFLLLIASALLWKLMDKRWRTAPFEN